MEQFKRAQVIMLHTSRNSGCLTQIIQFFILIYLKFKTTNIQNKNVKYKKESNFFITKNIMSKHSDFVTHINNQEDHIYLKTKHFPVNMRLFKTSEDYKQIILSQCNYIRKRCLETLEGYKKPHGMSSANLGLAHNIIGVTRNRNKDNEYCQIMINPVIVHMNEKNVETLSNCGSLTLEKPIKLFRANLIRVEYYDELGISHIDWFDRETGSFSIQHEIDHNLGILITDY